MYGDDLVYDSVMKANQMHAHEVKSHRVKCPKCQADEWRTRWGVDAQYKSEYNPGEYCEFTCNKCGYSYQEGC